MCCMTQQAITIYWGVERLARPHHLMRSEHVQTACEQLNFLLEK